MDIQVAHEVEIDNVLSSIKRPMLDGTANPNAEKLVDNFINGMRQNKDDMSISKVITVEDEKILEHFSQASVFMMYQLIETTPLAKKNLLKYTNEHKAQMIKDISECEELDEMAEILRKTPENLKQETLSITQLMSLAANEYNQGDRIYTEALLNAFPPLRKIVAAYERHTEENTGYQDTIQRIICGDTINFDAEEIQHIQETYNVDLTDDDFIQFIKTQGLHEIRRLNTDQKKVPKCDIDLVRSESKKLTSTHGQKRTFVHPKDKQPFEYTLRDMYFIGALHFLDDYLFLMPGSIYMFQSQGELRAYLKHSDLIHGLYASEAPLERIKTTKAKERPLRIQNGESFGSLLQFGLDSDDSRTWTQFLVGLYTQMDIRGDLLWNTVLNKRDIDTVTQLLKQWPDVIDAKSSIEGREQAYFMVGLMIMALEKQQQDNDDYIKETIIRMDEEQERALNTIIQQKEERVAYLESVVAKQNKSLSQMDSLRRKNAELEEQLAWQEDRIEQEENATQAIDEELPDMDTAAIRNRLNSEDVCFMGGDINWQTALKQELPEATFQLAEESGRSMRHVEKSKIIIYNTATMNHGLFYRFKNSLKRNPKSPILIYLNTQGSNKDLTYQRIGKQLLEKETEALS